MHDSKLEDPDGAAAAPPPPAAERASHAAPVETPAVAVDAVAGEPVPDAVGDEPFGTRPLDTNAPSELGPVAATPAAEQLVELVTVRPAAAEPTALERPLPVAPLADDASPTQAPQQSDRAAAMTSSPRFLGEGWSEGRPAARPTGAASALLTEKAEARETWRQRWRPGRLADWAPTLRRIVRLAALALAGWLALVVLLVAVFRFVDPPGSMLMLVQRLGGTTINQSWRDLDDISPELGRAVVAAEDARFCGHWGIDLDEIANAVRRARDGTPRGASTITMQVAKNLFLWPSKSYLRKALEVPVTLAIELFWPKRRIVEVYLNIAEWGPGVFGAEAAARHHFAKSAKRLTSRESALLAVTLPNPALRNAGKPSRMVNRLASLIERRATALASATHCLGPRRLSRFGASAQRPFPV
ncbi:MAG: monofunctional biosynthetic peptidoglycan transglycosylase [Pseudomonadota bacterium]